MLPMKRRIWSISVQCLFLCLCLCLFPGLLSTANGQAAKKTASKAAATATEATETLGVGLESRFNSGSTPVQAERVNITPGSPMNVKPTMDTMVGGDEKSFGGILSRYDTSNFGKFFASGSLAAKVTAAKATKLQMEDSRIDNSRADASRLYPPRLEWNPDEFPVSSLETPEVRQNVVHQVRNLEKRLGLSEGQVELVFSADCLILRGRIHSRDQANSIVNVLAFEPGVDRIENQLTVLEEKQQPARLVFPGR